MTDDLIPGAIYYQGDTTKAVVVAVVESIEVDQAFPVFVVVEDFNLKDGVWISDGTGLACDDDNGSDLMEDRLLDTFERGAGETWAEAIKREINEGLADNDRDNFGYELGAEAFAMGGLSAYNEAMGYGVVADYEDY